jgi:RNA polymerase sigma factor (TIGR02999 family)
VTPPPEHETPQPEEVTRLLIEWQNGDQQSLARLMPLVYTELKAIAGRYMSRETTGHTLQSTALVHEAYVRLVGQRSVRWQNRAHFFGIAGQMMRRILVDHARHQQRAKRGGPLPALSLDDAMAVTEPEASVDLIALDDALSALAAMDAHGARIVELRFFGGLTIEETAEVLGISTASVKREWATARAWLYRSMQSERGTEGP